MALTSLRSSQGDKCLELHPKDANLAVVKDDYSLPMASCTQWVEDLARGTTARYIQPSSVKLWSVLHVSSKQRNYTSGQLAG